MRLIVFLIFIPGQLFINISIVQDIPLSKRKTQKQSLLIAQKLFDDFIEFSIILPKHKVAATFIFLEDLEFAV